MKSMVLLVVACVVALVPVPAWATDELGLSPDGVAFSSTLSTPLFDPSFLWIPGDTEMASFWVRNQSPDHATLDVAILGSNVDSLMQTGDLAVTVEAADGSGSTTTTTGRQTLIASRPVAPGQTERINVTVALDPASKNHSQVKALDLRFEVRLTHDDASDGGDQGDAGGLLPDTGAEISVWLMAVAGVMLAVGSRLARRRQEVNHG